MFVVAENEVVPRCPLKLASEMGPYTSSTDQKTHEFLKYVVEREVVEDRWKSKSSAGRKEECVDEAARYMCLRRGMERTLRNMVKD